MIEYEPEELQSKINDLLAKVEAIDPDWRSKLPECGMCCAPFDGDVARMLNQADGYYWLLTGKWLSLDHN